MDTMWSTYISLQHIVVIAYVAIVIFNQSQFQSLHPPSLGLLSSYDMRPLCCILHIPLLLLNHLCVLSTWMPPREALVLGSPPWFWNFCFCFCRTKNASATAPMQILFSILQHEIIVAAASMSVLVVFDNFNPNGTRITPPPSFDIKRVW